MSSIMLFLILFCHNASAIKIQETPEVPQESVDLHSKVEHSTWGEFFNEAGEQDMNTLGGGRRRRRDAAATVTPPAIATVTDLTLTCKESDDSDCDSGGTTGGSPAFALISKLTVEVTMSEAVVITRDATCGTGCGTPFVVLQSKGNGLDALGAGTTLPLTTPTAANAATGTTDLVFSLTLKANWFTAGNVELVGNPIHANSATILSKATSSASNLAVTNSAASRRLIFAAEDTRAKMLVWSATGCAAGLSSAEYIITNGKANGGDHAGTDILKGGTILSTNNQCYTIAQTKPDAQAAIPASADISTFETTFAESRRSFMVQCGNSGPSFEDVKIKTWNVAECDGDAEGGNVFLDMSNTDFGEAGDTKAALVTNACQDAHSRSMKMNFNWLVCTQE